METLHDRLAQALERSGMKASELADQLDVSRATVSHWTNGRRDPAPNHLRRISEVLRVDHGWLAHGSDDGEAPPLVGDWFFRPAPADGGKDFGNPNVFATPSDVDTLCREVGQNTADAGASPAGRIELRYSLIEIDTTSPTFREFEEALSFGELLGRIRRAAETKSKLGSRLRSGLERLNDERKLVMLRIDDFGTTGLFGHEESTGIAEEKNPYAALVRNNLDSSKLTSVAGGSFGLGKAVLWRCSDLSTVLFASDIAPERRAAEESGIRVVGKSELTWHEYQGKGFAGPGWFGRRESSGKSMWVDDRALERIFLSRARLPDGVIPRRASGTSILILGFRNPKGDERFDAEDVAANLRRASAENFWPMIVDGRLRITVERMLGHEVEESHPVDPTEYVPQLCEAYEKHLRDEITEDPVEPGDVARLRVPLLVPATRPEARDVDLYPEDIESQCLLLVRLDEPTSEVGLAQKDRVAFVRGRGMVVKYYDQRGIVVGARPFHAALLAGEAVANDRGQQAAEQYLRLAEPPAHDEWELTDDIKDKYRWGAGKPVRDSLKRDLTEQLKRAISPAESGDDEGPRELKKLLRLGSALPKPPPPVTIREAEAVLVGDVWVVKADIVMNDRTKAWRVAPRIWLDVESGGAIRLPWRELSLESGHARLSDQMFYTDPAVKRFSFTGTSEADVDGIRAAECRLKLDLRVDEQEADNANG